MLFRSITVLERELNLSYRWEASTSIGGGGCHIEPLYLCMEVSFSIDNLSLGIEDIFNCFRTIFEK